MSSIFVCFFSLLCTLYLTISTAFLHSSFSCCKLNIVVFLIINYDFVKMYTFKFIAPWWPTKRVLIYLSSNILMVNTKYFENACLGGYQDSPIVYLFQSSKLFRIKTILKFMLPVIYLNLFYTSSFHTCEITSINIVLQRNNMHIMNVKFPCRTLKMSCTYKNAVFTKNIIMSYLCFTIWMIYLILLAGDVELNPGPASIDSGSISNDLSDSSMIDLSIFEQNFSIVHYNIQSLVGKLDQIQIELSHFDVIALFESWLSDNVSTDEILFQNYQMPIRKDRVEKFYGGVIIYVKENIPCRLDLEIDGLECIWL